MTALLLTLEAWIETIRGDKHGLQSNLAVLLMWLAVGVFWLQFGTWLGFLVYPVLRFCFFDYLYNSFKGLNMFYLGGTSKTDQILKRVNPYLLLAIRVKLLILTIWIL